MTADPAHSERPYLRVSDLRRIITDLPDEMFVYVETGSEIGHLVSYDSTDCWDESEGNALLLTAEDDIDTATAAAAVAYTHAAHTRRLDTQ